MSDEASEQSKFMRYYWYQLVWALEDFERRPVLSTARDESSKTRALFTDALTRLENFMDTALLAEVRESHRRKVAGGRWRELRRKLESFERPPRGSRSREMEQEKLAIQRELLELERELGPEEISRIVAIKPLPLCGTALLHAREWTAEKQREGDIRLLRDVDDLLAARNHTH